MAIRIQQLNVKNLGPIHDFSHQFRLINLIYGHNEQGKTYLVEFIYRSLFKNMALLNPRPITASGRLIVSGLRDEEISFSPSSKKKMEYFWTETNPGLPADFSRLLVVKGGDLDLTPDDPAGLDDQILKNFLSGEMLLGKISAKIRPTDSSAVYEHGKILGIQRGAVKNYVDLSESIQQIDALLQEIQLKISGGRRWELSQEIEGIKKQLRYQELAKKRLALTLSREMEEIEAQLQKIPKEPLDDAERLIAKYALNQSILKKKEQDLSENLQTTRHYPWLAAAVEEYQKQILLEKRTDDQTGNAWLIAAVLATSLSISLILIQQSYFGIPSILLTLLFGFFYIQSYRKQQSNEIHKMEIEKIEQNFRERFSTSGAIGLSVLLSKQQALQPAYYSIQQIRNDIRSSTSESEDTSQDIRHLLKKYTNQQIDPKDWQPAIDNLQKKREALETSLHRKEDELSKLDFNEDSDLYFTDTILDEPSSSPVNDEGENLDDAIAEVNSEQPIYDKARQHELIDLLKKQQHELNAIDQQMQQLKQAVCTITKSDINIVWEELIERLTEKRAEIVSQYKEVTAAIIAQMQVNCVLDELKQIEGEKIEKNLRSTQVSETLLSATGRYNKIEQDNGDLVLSDSYGKYKLKELSTGAKEQVLFGLRIGFASKLLSGEPQFLILDDAFQHSDWNRRERLTELLANLAKRGWQIFYFSMDDHIKQLFEEKIRPEFQEDFCSIMLDQT